MTTQPADHQPKDKKVNPEQPVQEYSLEQTTNIFALGDFSQPSTDQVLHLQRTIGNTKTQALLRQQTPRAARRIQREIGGGTTGGGISATGAKLTWERTHKFPARVMGLAKLQIEAGVAAEVELSWSKAPVSVGAETKTGTDGALKAKGEIWKAKVDKEAQEKEDVLQSILSDHLSIAKAELEFEVPKHSVNTEKKEQKTSMGAALVITMKGGDKHKIFINAFEAVMKGDDTDISFMQAGGEASFQLVPSRFREAALAEGLTLKGGLFVKGKATVSPNWPAVAAQLAQRFGPAFLGQALRGAATGGAWVTSGLISGGIATIRGYYGFMQQIAELKQMRREADAAVPGYASGFMKGIGVTAYSGGDAGWATYGQARGQAALATGLAEMKKRLAAMAQTYGVEPSTIKDEELSEMLTSVIHEKTEAIYSELYGGVNIPIRMLYYNKYKETNSVDTPGEEMNVRAYAGLPTSGALPDAFEKKDVPMESPAGDNGGGGAAKPTNTGGSSTDEDVGMFEPMPGQDGPMTNPYGGSSQMPTAGDNANSQAEPQQTLDDNGQQQPPAAAPKPKAAPARNNSGRTAIEQAEAEAKELKLREDHQKQQNPGAPIERNLSGRTEAEQAAAEAEELKQRQAAGIE